MLTTDSLAHYPILEKLSTQEVEQVLPICQEVHFDEGQTIYREGDAAETFFLLKSGTVLLEQRIHKTMVVTVGTLKPGAAFGLTAILDQTGYSLDAVSADACELIMINGPALMDLFEKNSSIGYKMIRATVTIIQNRLSQRTQQFVRSIATHPDIYALKEEAVSS
ncbi:cyclic nucleotide-binding domain-containing protein [Desulfobotulus sp. H1]|uniref:Cyclic nucleotide-binding domain-containing protein n=1 Tax=Desulfobotulus pelophilus TaxID=2823377 RepID=A0ABT3NC56_9BACT|nr:cyclic nucleotide-binding domain-containing protein [Desulfobotulus pelophilus]MCW7754756.1 cyclic nucleotide-binding domain-containing protein [Desulfobotulus pelophilus]